MQQDEGMGKLISAALRRDAGEVAGKRR